MLVCLLLQTKLQFVQALAGKEIEMNDDGTYIRKIGGSKHTKTLLGMPL
jgi:hypothetical protein